MKGFFRRNGGLILVIALILSVLIGIGGALSRGKADPLSNIAGAAAAPLRRGVSAVLDWAEGVYAYVFRYHEMNDQLRELRARVAELEEEALAGREAVLENDRLRDLLELSRRRRDFVFEAAHVTAHSTSGWDSTLTLSKGSSAGLAAGNCVITETGALVGVVTETGLNWSTVATVTDAEFEMGGVVSRTRSTGVLEGDFTLMQDGRLRLSYLPDNAQFLTGDRVLTSGRGDIYPSGLTVGSVEEVVNDPSGQFRYAVICPEADADALTEVFVIKSFEIVE